jgi:hypothetical protein
VEETTAVDDDAPAPSEIDEEANDERIVTSDNAAIPATTAKPTPILLITICLALLPTFSSFIPKSSSIR